MKALAIGLLLGLPLAACGTDAKPCDPTEPNTICTIAGKSLDEGYSGDNGLATNATLYIPIDSIVTPSGDVWFLDFNNYVVRSIDASGMISTVVGNGQLGSSPASDHLPFVPALNAYGNHTTQILMSNGYLYLSSWHESRVKRVKLADMTMELFAGAGMRTYYTGDGGPAIMAAVDLPSGIAVDPAGNFTLMDSGNQVVRQIDSTGTIHTIVGQCIVEQTPCGGAVVPTACPGSNKLVCGDPTACDATQCAQSFGGDNGPATTARLSLPYGQQAAPGGRIIYDHLGNLLIADTANNRIRKVDTAGMITTLAGSGDQGYSGDGGPATAASLNYPVDMAIGPDNSVYIADVENNCIRKVDPAGIISTAVGQCSPNPADRGFAGDGGPPLEAKLNRPFGLDLVDNRLYVSDSYNNRLRVVNLP